MDEILYLSLLYDFYGELLTELQRTVFSMHRFEDMSLTEIGERLGTSKQAVSDLLRRTEKKLAGYEDKLALVKNHLANTTGINQ